jgi:hypothetical protein
MQKMGYHVRKPESQQTAKKAYKELLHVLSPPAV